MRYRDCRVCTFCSFVFVFVFFFVLFFLAKEMDDALVMLKMEEAGFSTAVAFPSQP